MPIKIQKQTVSMIEKRKQLENFWLFKYSNSPEQINLVYVHHVGVPLYGTNMAANKVSTSKKGTDN